MSVFQRSDGRWVVKYKDNLGKRIQKSFKEEEDARRFEDELYVDSREGSRLTVFEAVMLHVKDHDFSPHVNEQYTWLVCGAERKSGRSIGYAECIADKYVDELTRRDLNEVRDNIRAKGSSNATINLWTKRLCAAFNYCVSEDLVKVNPWAHIRKLPERHLSRMASLEDFQKLYEIMPEWWRWICRTAISLCLRPGMTELFSMQWKQYDFAHGAVTVHMGKVGRDKVVYPIKEYMDEAKERFFADGSDREQYVCRNSWGRQMKHWKFSWDYCCAKAGVKFPPYAMRHIAATQMLAAGADVAAVAANLGHSTPSTTLNYYAHALPSAQRAACTKMGAIWCENRKKDSIKSIG